MILPLWSKERAVRRHPCLVVGVGLALTISWSSLAGPASAAPAVAKPYDFNGDGYPELVAGAPGARIGSVDKAGEFVVVPGSRRGLSSTGQQRISLATPGVSGDPLEAEGFGSVFASADFDRDGFADLAVGPAQTSDSSTAGAVTILYGSKTGLSPARSKQLRVMDVLDDESYLGVALTVGDFDGDGYPELAVGVGGAYFDDDGSGAVIVYTGGAAGFSDARSALVRGNTDYSGGDEEFGVALAAVDLDQDGRSDLIVGSGSGDTVDGTSPGAVSACYGTTKGLASCVRLDRSLVYAGLSSLAVGNVSGSARPEVVVGVDNRVGSDNPHPDPHNGGTVDILSLSGTRAKTTVKRVQLSQNSPGVPGADEYNDLFGYSLVLGDLDHDGYDDLVVGVPEERTRGHNQAGRLVVIQGARTGHRKTGNRSYDQDSKGIPGEVEYGDRFGEQVSLIDHDADGYLDLDVSAPGENGRRGSVTSLRGSEHPFGTTKARVITEKKLGYPAPEERVYPYLGRGLGR